MGIVSYLLSRMVRSSGKRNVQGELEVAHFWQEGDGMKPFEAVLSEFAEQYPTVDVRDESYGNHGLSIKSRILQERPPPVFLEWPDRNLVPYDEAGSLKDISDLWEREGWTDVFIEGPREKVRLDGRYVGVPIDIHRMNNLFYNVELTEQLGIDPHGIGDSREFLEVLRQCEDAPVVGFQQPMKNPWTVIMLWCEIFMGQFGGAAFEELTQGDPTGFESEIRESLQLLDAYADLASDDAEFLGMVGANERFIDGESVFFYQGDWVAGEYGEIDGFDYGSEWDHVPFPGTEDIYRLGMDSFVASPEAGETAMEFLSFAGSPTALQTFNQIKGSIPPRRDLSLDEYPRFLQEQHEDFTRTRYQPAGHSFQVTPEVFIEVKEAFSDFMIDRDVDGAARELNAVYTGR